MPNLIVALGMSVPASAGAGAKRSAAAAGLGAESESAPKHPSASAAIPPRKTPTAEFMEYWRRISFSCTRSGDDAQRIEPPFQIVDPAAQPTSRNSQFVHIYRARSMPAFSNRTARLCEKNGQTNRAMAPGWAPPRTDRASLPAIPFERLARSRGFGQYPEPPAHVSIRGPTPR